MDSLLFKINTLTNHQPTCNSTKLLFWLIYSGATGERTVYARQHPLAIGMSGMISCFLSRLRLTGRLYKSQHIRGMDPIFSTQPIFRWRPILSIAMNTTKSCSPMESRALRGGLLNTRGEYG